MGELISVPLVVDVVRVEGRDALTYLQSQLTQDLRDLAVGAAVPSLLLQPAGRVDALVRVRRVADEVVEVDVDAGFSDVVVARLQRFKIRVAADITTSPRALVAVRGLGAAEAVATAGVDALAAWWGDGDSVDVLAGADVGIGRPGTAAELHAAHVRAGWPAMGAEILPGQSLPAETGVIPVAVSFTKGCYPGQELVERMDSRGATAPRSLRRLVVAAGAQPGDDVVVNGAVVGTLTSVAGTDALGSVKRGVDIGTAVGASGR